MAGSNTFPSPTYSPAPAPLLDKVCFRGHCRYVSVHRHEVLIESTSITIMSTLVLAFFVTVTENRLWSSNRFFRIFLQRMEHPVLSLLGTAVLLILGFPYHNELYILWAVLLMIASQCVLCVMGYGFLSVDAMKLVYLQWLVYNIFNGIVIGFFVRDSMFRYPLWILWSLTTLKFLLRFISLFVAERRYSIRKVNLIADYMKHEHESIQDTTSDCAIPEHKSSQEAQDTTLIADFATPEHKSSQDTTLIADFATLEHESSQDTNLIADCTTRERGISQETDLIADYTTPERERSQERSPFDMQQYKYIVFGEERVKANEMSPPDYEMSLDMRNPLVVTTDKLWAQNEGLLSSEFDPKGRNKDLCLSFALFKLLRRRYLNYPAGEAGQPKTRDFVFRGLLCEEDKQRVFRIIKSELGFCKDLMYSKQPIIFCNGIPAYNFILTFLTMGIAGWLAKIAYHNYHRKDLDRDEVLNITRTGKNIDLYVTYILVGLIIAMGVIEFCAYILSDWARVMFIRMYLNKPWLHHMPFLDKAFSLCGTSSLLQPLNNVLGQYSLLKKRPGRRQYRHITLPPQVKDAIFDSLQVNGDSLSNGASSLSRNGVNEQLSWACKFPTDLHTIIVWHVATSYCEIIPSQQNKVSDKIVATSLSKYCAYLVVFVPDLLPGSAYATGFVFDKVLNETRDFFNGRGNMYNKMKEVHDDEEKHGREAMIVEGLKLGKKLEAMDVQQRWKVLADFWAELLVYLAPSDRIITHLRRLQFGGEFITHIWVLLYHAGIVERPSQPCVHWSRATKTA